MKPHYHLRPISAGILTDRMFYADGVGGAAGATLVFGALTYGGSNEMEGITTGTGSLTSTCSTTHYSRESTSEDGYYQLYGTNSAVWADGRVALTGAAGTEVTNTYADNVSDVLLSPLPSINYFPAATNSVKYSNDMANWSHPAGLAVLDETGITGESNTATTITGTASGSICQDLTVAIPISGATNTIKVWIKKNASTQILFVFNYGPSQTSYQLQLDSVTGGYTFPVDPGGAAAEIISHGDWWIIVSSITHSGAGTNSYFSVYPDRTGGNTACIIGQCESHNDKTIAEVRGLGPIFTTTGSVTTVKIDPISVPVANHSDTDGLYYCEWTPSYSTADATGNQVILSLDGGAGLLYYDATAGAFKSTDGTNTVSVTKTIVADTTYKLFLLYHAGEASMQVSVDSTDGTAGTYDGGFITTGDLEFSGGGTYAHKLRDWRKYDISSMAEGATQRDSLK